MEHTKKSIRDLILRGQLEKAGAAGLAYAEYCGLPEIGNAFTTIIARSRKYHEDWTKGIISYEDFSLHHARSIHDITTWIHRLPDQASPASRKVKLVTEASFKKGVFYALCITKIIVISRLAYHWSTGGFNNDQFQATVALLAPTLAAYISVILADYLRQHHADISSPRYLSGPLVTFSWVLFPVYALLLLLFLELKAKTVISFIQMNFWLALTESVLGGYIGQLVFAFFKKVD